MLTYSFYIERANTSVAKGLPMGPHFHLLSALTYVRGCWVLAPETSVLKGGFHLNLTTERYRRRK